LDFYVFGGTDGTTYTSQLWSWSLLGQNWNLYASNLTNPPPGQRAGHSAAAMAGNIFFFGGFNGTTYFNDLWHFQVGNKQWTMLPTTTYPPARNNHNSWIYAGCLFIFGGFNNLGGTNNFLGDVWRYCFSGTNANNWSQVNTQCCVDPAPRFGAAGSMFGQYYYIFSGHIQTLPDPNDFWRFNLVTFAWERIVSDASPSARTGSVAVSIGANLYLFGGTNYLQQSMAYFNDLWTFNLGMNCATGGDTNTTTTTGPAIIVQSNSKPAEILGVATALLVFILLFIIGFFIFNFIVWKRGSGSGESYSNL